jgi:hypothetical protein
MDLRHPDSCPVTQSFLQALSQSGDDSEKRGEAVQMFVTECARRQDGQYGKARANLAALLLERPVFVRTLQAGLEETLLGRKFSVQKAVTNAEYLSLLHLVAIDERTVKVLLRASPNMFEMFASYLTERKVSSEREWLDFCALQGLALLSQWSKSILMEIGKKPEFLKNDLQKVLKDGGVKSQRLEMSLVLGYNALMYTKITPSLARLLVELAEEVLAESDVPEMVVCASGSVDVLNCFYPQFRHFLLHKEDLFCSSLAIAACKKAPEIARQSAKGVLPLFHPEWLEIATRNPSHLLNKIQQRLASDARASHRADRLRNTVFAEREHTPDQPTIWVAELRSDFEYSPGKMPSIRKDTRNDTYLLGAPAVERIARRKCSFSECSSVETRSGQFKVCSSCRLALYCSRGECIQRCF